jgi:hypothetical protein
MSAGRGPSDTAIHAVYKTVPLAPKPNFLQTFTVVFKWHSNYIIARQQWFTYYIKGKRETGDQR